MRWPGDRHAVVRASAAMLVAGLFALPLDAQQTSAPAPTLEKSAPVAEPEGYRMEDYKAPVPATLAGATVVTVKEAHALWQAGKTGFVDVLPHPPKPANLPEGTVWHDKPRISIPGAIWLPNTGYGDIAPETLTYFLDGLARVTGGDRQKNVLFFCLPNCWMSWNAAKRAIAEGYTNVYWMPDGSEGWAKAGYPTETLKA